MDIATNTHRFVTTIQIPLWLAKDIKAAGMTYNGALIAGWAAMSERKAWNEEIAALRVNMERYRQGYIKLSDEMAKLRVQE
jgi:hypothetical protein